MTEPPLEPEKTTIRKALAELVREGLVPYHVGDVGGPLVGLAIVQAELGALDGTESEDARSSAHTTALTTVLTAAVADDDMGGKSRRLLHEVLPLKQENIGKSAKERRVAAGKNIRKGQRVVKPGTIRTYYEPKALEKLTDILLRMDGEHRSTTSADGNPEADEASES